MITKGLRKGKRNGKQFGILRKLEKQETGQLRSFKGVPLLMPIKPFCWLPRSKTDDPQLDPTDRFFPLMS